MLSSLWALTKNAFTEIIRQPIYGILVGVGVVLIALSPLIAMFTLLENDKLVVDMGLATIFLIGLVLAVLAASQIISREIESRTAGAVMSKPVGRFLFVVSKFLGVTLAMAVATFLFTVVLLLTLRIGVPSAAWSTTDYPALLGELVPFLIAILLAFYCNYFYRWNFGAAAVVFALPLYALSFVVLLTVNSQWQFDWIPAVYYFKNMWEVSLAAVLVFMGVWVISSIAVVASTRLNVVPNVLVCLGVFFVGMVSHYLFGQYAPQSLFTTTQSGQVVQELEQGKIPEGLRQTFEERGYPLSQYAGVTGRGDGRWVVTGGEDEFLISRSGRRLEVSRDGSYLAWVAYRAVPNLQAFWVADQLMRAEPYIPISYPLVVGGYAVAFAAAMLTLATFLFEKRELI